MESWSEVNISPAGGMEGSIARIVPSLVNDAEAWFFFWEPADGELYGADEQIRLRILGGDPGELKRLLDAQVKAGAVERWYAGAHGIEGRQYEGEADFYGEPLWRLMYRQWHASSSLALEIAVLEAAGKLPKPRSFYWRRLVHLTSVWLEVPEVRMCIEQAQRYLSLTGALEDGRDCRFAAEMDRWLYG